MMLDVGGGALFGNCFFAMVVGEVAHPNPFLAYFGVAIFTAPSEKVDSRDAGRISSSWPNTQF